MLSEATGWAPADWLLLLAALLWATWALGTRAQGHFRRRGLPYKRGLWPFLGNAARPTAGLVSFADFMRECYDDGRGHALFGIFNYLRPVLMVRHPDHVRRVLVKDFDHFSDHHPLFSEKLNPLIARSLVTLKGQEWREMRSTLSPAFTTSKMRVIYELIDECGEQMVRHVDEQIANSPDQVFAADTKDLFTRFANDVIATAAFGVRVDSLRQPANEFYAMGKDLTDVSGLRVVFLIGFLLFPRLMDMLRLSFVSNKVLTYFNHIVHGTIRERQKQGIFRPDMLQLLMQARAGELDVEKEDEHEAESIKAEKRKLTDEDITSQAAIFFFAGFENVSRLMCLTAMTLAQRQDVQQRLQRHLDEVLANHGGKLSYEALQEMKYLDMVISEVQRLHSGDTLDRICVKDYTFPAVDGSPAYTVSKGEYLWVPQHGLHLDPDYWPDPDTFDPERFGDDNKGNIKPFTYMPFGLGPRVCIASRFALMELKVALAQLLRRHAFVMTPKTPQEIKYSRLDVTDGIAGGYCVGIAPR